MSKKLRYCTIEDFKGVEAEFHKFKKDSLICPTDFGTFSVKNDVKSPTKNQIDLSFALIKDKKDDIELDKFFSSFIIEIQAVAKSENMTKFGEEPTNFRIKYL